MFDLKWALMRGFMWGLKRVGRGRGKFVFAVVARPEPQDERIAIQVVDTTAIPAGKSVRELIDHIVQLHMHAAMMQFMERIGKTPLETLPGGILASLHKTTEEGEVDLSLPARSWKSAEAEEM